jgi:hypothetical protein
VNFAVADSVIFDVNSVPLVLLADFRFITLHGVVTGDASNSCSEIPKMEFLRQPRMAGVLLTWQLDVVNLTVFEC